MRLLRRRAPDRPLPRHPVTVTVSLTTGAVVIEGRDEQIERIVEHLAKAGIRLDVTSRGPCG